MAGSLSKNKNKNDYYHHHTLKKTGHHQHPHPQHKVVMAPKSTTTATRNNRQCVVSLYPHNETALVEKSNNNSSCSRTSTSIKGGNSCRKFNRLVMAVLFIVLTVCVCVYAAGSVIQENINAQMTSYKEELRNEMIGTARGEFQKDETMGGLSSLFKRETNNNNGRGGGRRGGRRGGGGRRRGSNNRRGSRRQTRRDAPCPCPHPHRHQQRTPQEKPSVHMNIVPSIDHFTEMDVTHHTDGSASCHTFVWTKSEERPVAGLNFTRHPDRESPNDITGVKIAIPGTYDVYSQVIAKGPSSQYPYYRAQDIVRYRGNQKTVLLRSFITQQSFNLNGIAKEPLDTVFQYGVFYFRRNDVIKVETCHGALYSNADQMDKAAFFFGVAQR